MASSASSVLESTSEINPSNSSPEEDSSSDEDEDSSKARISTEVRTRVGVATVFEKWHNDTLNLVNNI